MYYSNLVKKASQIAYEAHKEDVDKGGYPYIFHPFLLASQLFLQRLQRSRFFSFALLCSSMFVNSLQFKTVALCPASSSDTPIISNVFPR